MLFYLKEINFKLSCSYGPGRYDATYEEGGLDYPYAYVRWTERRNMESVLMLAAEGRLVFEDLITHRFDFADVDSAYKLLDGGGWSCAIVWWAWGFAAAVKLPLLLPHTNTPPDAQYQTHPRAAYR